MYRFILLLAAVFMFDSELRAVDTDALVEAEMKKRLSGEKKSAAEAALEKQIQEEISDSLNANKKAREREEKMEKLCMESPDSEKCKKYQAYQDRETKRGISQLGSLIDGVTGGAVKQQMKDKQEDRLAEKVAKYCEGGEKPNAKLCKLYSDKLGI